MIQHLDRNRRDQLLAAGAMLLFVLLLWWGWSSYRSSLEQLKRQVESSRTELADFDARLQDYRLLERALSRLRASSRGKGLISSVEDAAARIGARSKLAYVRPQPDRTVDSLTAESVEIRLEKLQLNQLVEFLYRIEASRQALRVTQLRLRTRFENPAQLDAVLLLSRFREG